MQSIYRPCFWISRTLTCCHSPIATVRSFIRLATPSCSHTRYDDTIMSVIMKMPLGRKQNIGNHRVTCRARVHGLHAVVRRVVRRDLDGMNVRPQQLEEHRRKTKRKKADLAVAVHRDLQKRKCNERVESKGQYVLRTSAADATRMRAASRAFPCFSCACLFLLDYVQEHIRNTQILYLHPRRIRGWAQFFNESERRRTVLPRM
jgi:hypothetical protein